MYGAGPLVEHGGGLDLQISKTPWFSIRIITTWSKYVPAGALAGDTSTVVDGLMLGEEAPCEFA